MEAPIEVRGGRNKTVIPFVVTWRVREFAKVLEYYPAPWNTWVKIGNLPSGRALHAVLPIGPQHIACVAGEEHLKSSVFSS